MPLKVRMSSARQLLLAALLFPPLGLAPWPACAQTMIDLTYDSTMDMVRPEPHPGIIVHHNLEIFFRSERCRKSRPERPGILRSECGGPRAGRDRAVRDI